MRPINVNAELKAATYSALRLAINREQLLLPTSATELIRELLLLKVEITPAGLERVETGGRDFASALMLSCGPYQRDGRWRSTLIDVIEQRVSAPVLPPELLALPTVATPGGIALPRSPAWQSVAGQELSLPEAALPAALEDRRHAVLKALRDRVRAHLTDGTEVAA